MVSGHIGGSNQAPDFQLAGQHGFVNDLQGVAVVQARSNKAVNKDGNGMGGAEAVDILHRWKQANRVMLLIWDWKVSVLSRMRKI